MYTIIAGLRKLADACPLCGNSQALNNKFTTKCPNINCENYDLELSLDLKSKDLGKPSPVGTLEYKDNDFKLDKSMLMFDRYETNQLDLPEPYKAELKNLLGKNLISFSLSAFSADKLPSGYKSKTTGLFTKIKLGDSTVLITDKDSSVYYCADLYNMYDFLKNLQEIFGSL